ncbi:protein SPO16 homolog isoform X2 [Pangasianodon hypophthalmus]|uniref:protein SPO16 homolog isoform X2 n=1 Tax=Pangasianodon hypophthalmus TaxID=310915 RepID=UPI000EFFFDC0|nr:protein SPO16 homolog isoform X2 [Pangasianodon hypophthalmus]
MANNNTETLWKTTVIVSTSLQNNEISVVLLAQQHLLRYSDSIDGGTLVFPLSGVAFLLITPEEFPEKAECEEFFRRIEKFIQVHRNSFLLLQAPAYGARELEIVSAVQNRFFGSNLKVLPVHSNGDAVKGMLTIAKATSKPHVDRVRERMHVARAHIIENSLETLLKKVEIFKVV